MAWSRLEKIGTIFSRVNGLLRAGALKEEDKPLWFEIYKRIPPVDEPKFDRPAKDMIVRKIFYPEDVVRAKFHKVYGSSYRTNLADHGTSSKSQEFLKIYNCLIENGEFSEDVLFEKAVDKIGFKTLDAMKTSDKIDSSDNMKYQEIKDSLATSFRKAKENRDTDVRKSNVNIKDIFEN